MAEMIDKTDSQGSYSIEVSGWGPDNIFFVEKTDLHCSQSGVKRVLLHRTLPVGGMVFVRLLPQEYVGGSVPVPYQIQSNKPVESNGMYEMSLLRVRPRIKAPIEGRAASYAVEDSIRPCEPRESLVQLEPEEVLQ
jgi:hypothetical protein